MYKPNCHKLQYPHIVLLFWHSCIIIIPGSYSRKDLNYVMCEDLIIQFNFYIETTRKTIFYIIITFRSMLHSKHSLVLIKYDNHPSIFKHAKLFPQLETRKLNMSFICIMYPKIFLHHNKTFTYVYKLLFIL